MIFLISVISAIIVILVTSIGLLIILISHTQTTILVQSVIACSTAVHAKLGTNTYDF